MAEDWSIDVKKYAPNADDGVIAAIVKHCGIALQSRDASLVSFTDPAELDVVRESWLKKKLGLTDPDSVLDAAIAKVGDIMKADHTKNRVTVYYLLAEAFGKLGMFGAVAAPVVAAAPVAAAAIPPVAAPAAASGGGGLRAALLGLLALGAIGLIWWWMHRPAEPAAPVVAETTVTETTVTETTTPAAAPAVPEGAGVTATEAEGKPKVSVYFDTAKSDVSPDFATVAAPVKAYVDANPGAVIGVSGFNDPRGDAAFNAELSKSRAKAVRTALVALGVPETAIDLVKPSETTDTTDALAEGRRVDIYVKE